MQKLIIVDGLPELDKLETQSKVKFKLFIPRGTIKTKAPQLIWSTHDGTNMVVIGTADFVAVSKMAAGQPVPEGAVTATYFKL